MVDINKLVESYFKSKEEESLGLDGFFKMLQEVSMEVEKFGGIIQEEKEVVRPTAKEFILSLPKFTPSEAWGEPTSVARQEMEKFFRTIRGASVDEKIKYLSRLGREVPKRGREITSPRRIISTLILLESLSSCLNDFSAPSAGFVFEGFLAGLLGGFQVADPVEGSLPIEDVHALDTNMSLKVLRPGRTVGIYGSYTNLIIALTEKPLMKYVVAYKSTEEAGERKIVSGIDIISFDLTQDNFLDIMKGSKNNKDLLKLPKKTTRESVGLLSTLTSWDEMLPYLQRSAGWDTRRELTTVDSNEASYGVLDPYEEEVPEEEDLPLNEGGGAGGRQWYTNIHQLEKIRKDVDFKDLGVLNVSPESLEKTAERYMGELNDSIVFLFTAVSNLSQNINSYFVVKNRGTAINKGNAAIGDTEVIAKQMEALQSKTEAEEDEI